MKKTILAVALPLIIYGCSDESSNLSNADKFKTFEQNYLAATQTVINKSTEFSTGAVAYEANFSNVNDQVSLQDQFTYTDQQNAASIEYNITSQANVDLAKYNPENGRALIKGQANGGVVIDVEAAGETVKLNNLFANADYEGTLDEKAKTFSYNVKMAKNTVPVLLSDVAIAELTLNDFTNDIVLNFNKDYTDLTALKSGSEGKSIQIKATGELAKEVDANIDLTKLVSSTNYQASPLKYETVASLGNLAMSATNKNSDNVETFKFDVSKIEAKSGIYEEKGLLSGNVAYHVGNVAVTKDQSPKLDFGAISVDTNIKGIKNIKNWKALIEQANALSSQDPSDMNEAEAQEFLKTIASLFTKDTRLNMSFENKLTIGDELKASIAFQLSEKLVTLLQEGPEAIEAMVENQSPVDLIDAFIHEFSFKGKVTEDYIIAQYEKFLTLDGQDTASAKKDVQGAIQMVMMLVGMQSAQLGASPLEYKERTLFMDIEFKQGTWNINGKKLTTAEIFAAFQ